MYEYLDRFVKEWSDDELISILGRIPDHPIFGNSWSKIIAAVGVKNFIHLTQTVPNQEIRIPSLFEVLCIVAAEGIITKAETMTLEEAKREVLGGLEINEVNDLVRRLRSSAESSETDNAS